MVSRHRHVVSLLRGQCQIRGVIVGFAFQKGSHFRKFMFAIFHYKNMQMKITSLIYIQFTGNVLTIE